MKINDAIKVTAKKIVNEFGITKSVVVIGTGLASGFAGIAATSIAIPNKPIVAAMEIVNSIEEEIQNEEN